MTGAARAGPSTYLGVVQLQTGDYPAATAGLTQALQLFRDLSDRQGQAWALNHLGMVQQLTGDYPAATASLTEALQLFRELGERPGEAEALINLGELLFQSSAYPEACGCFTDALSIARDINAPVQEARALEGIGQSQIREGNPGQGTEHLRQALAIYRRIGAPDVQRIETTLQRLTLTRDDHRQGRRDEPRTYGLRVSTSSRLHTLPYPKTLVGQGSQGLLRAPQKPTSRRYGG